MRQKETKNGLVALTDLQDAIESEMLQDLLRQEQIPVMVRGDEGSGDYLKIYMGYSMFGESLYVRAADYERAKELLAGLRHNGEAALQEAQPEAFDDVECFEQYEAEKTPADHFDPQANPLQFKIEAPVPAPKAPGRSPSGKSSAAAAAVP